MCSSNAEALRSFALDIGPFPGDPRWTSGESAVCCGPQMARKCLPQRAANANVWLCHASTPNNMTMWFRLIKTHLPEQSQPHHAVLGVDTIAVVFL